jgi:hypothetical protein
MATQIVMDATGDIRHEFDPADDVAVVKAEERFKELTEAGFTAAVRKGQGRSELIRSFDFRHRRDRVLPPAQGWLKTLCSSNSLVRPPFD